MAGTGDLEEALAVTEGVVVAGANNLEGTLTRHELANPHACSLHFHESLNEN